MAVMRTKEFATGSVPYPEVAQETAETWTPPGHPLEASLLDGDGHPLTWGRVLAAHGWLTHHANCAGADVLGLSDATGYDSDDDRCPCTYHPVAIEERASHYHACRAWPGPICGESAGWRAASAASSSRRPMTLTPGGRQAVCVARRAARPKLIELLVDRAWFGWFR